VSRIDRFLDSHAECRGQVLYSDRWQTRCHDGRGRQRGSACRATVAVDVALSFADAQRAYVEKVAAALQGRGVRCFYNTDEQIELWGKYLAEELPAI